MAQQSNAFNQNEQNDQNKQQDVNQPQQLSSGPASAPMTSQGRTAAFSTGAAPQSQGASGRFTNLKNYMNANTQATQNLGAKANQQLGQAFQKGKDELDNQNKQIANTFQSANQNLEKGTGFEGQLKTANTDLNKGFTDFFDRGAFDTAAQSVMGLANDQDYSNIASGQGFDENAALEAQRRAVAQGQNVFNTTQENLRNIETEQGRDKLFSQVLKPKQGYTAGQQAFDRLFLGGALNDIKANTQQNFNEANKILAGTSAQQSTLDELQKRESDLLNSLTGLNQSNFQAFEKNFGNQANIDQVNKARDERYNRVRTALETGGELDLADAEALGIANPNTFYNENFAPSTQAQGKTQTPTSNSYMTSLYNLIDRQAVGNFLNKGKSATSLNDITSQQDLDAYKALSQLAGKQGGLLTGVSTLGSSFSSNRDLGKELADADKAFRDTYGSKSYNAGAALSGVDQARDVGQYYNSTSENPNAVKSGYVGNTAQTESFFNNLGGSTQDLLKRQMDALNSVTQNKENMAINAGGKKYGTGTYGGGLDLASAVSQSNLADYLRSGLNVNAESDFKSGNLQSGTSDPTNYTRRTGYLEGVAKDTATRTLKDKLENILNKEGVRNTVNVNTADPNKYKRFKGLV